MSNIFTKHLLVTLFIVTSSLGCGGSDSPDEETINNNPPVANAGSDQAVETNQTVLLDGSASSDANNDTLTFRWSLVSSPTGSGASLSDATLSNPTFIADLDGVYTLELIVNDAQADSNGDTVVITASTVNIAPIANAGSDQIVETNQTVQLDGSASSDANNDTLTFRWSLVGSPTGSGATLSDATLSNPTFIADLDGVYTLELIVNDNLTDSDTDTVVITASTANIAPIANAGSDQIVETNQTVQLDGSASSDANNDFLTYSWSFSTRPEGSNATLDNSTLVNPIFVPDRDGSYILSLVVDDSLLTSDTDMVTVTSSSVAVVVEDDFEGDNRLLVDYTTNLYTTNNENSLPDITRTDGRYRANLVDNAGDITLHFNDLQGRLDAKLVNFPFNYIARNIGIGTQDNSQIPPAGTGNPYIFAGIQVHVPELDSRNSSHIVVGHRGGSRYFTVEGKNTVNGSSSVNDDGANVAPDGRADLRVVGNEDRSLTIYWQLPNLTGNSDNDNWTLYRGNGNLPGTAPIYGSSVYIGLITYAQGSQGIPFVGTCDAIELGL